MLPKEGMITVNGYMLSKAQVEEFRARWDRFTYQKSTTSKAIIDLLAFAHITGENPTEEILTENQTDPIRFQESLSFFKRQNADDKRITNQMLQDEREKFHGFINI